MNPRVTKLGSRVTEPEVGADIVAALDNYVRQGGQSFEKITVQHSAGGLFPDIVVWTDFSAHKAFAIWELKAPGLSEDISRLPDKCSRLGVSYVVVWNFQSGELYEIKDRRLQILKSYPIPLLSTLQEWTIAYKRFAVIEQAKRILDDLARLLGGQGLTAYVPDRYYFIGILQKAIFELTPILQEHISRSRKKSEIRINLNKWAVKQGYPVGLPDFDGFLARHWAYSIAVRLLFYFTIRRYYPGLPDLRGISKSKQKLAELLWDAFSKAHAVDWQAVFERSPLDNLGFPSEAEFILSELIEGFHRFDFHQLKEDVVGQIMEGLIPEEERHALGQYFTREDLVDFIIGFVVCNDEAYYLDPTCGSGTFLNRLYSRLKYLSNYRSRHSDLLERIWGVDIAPFPGELATVNLFRQDVKDLSNFPRIIVRDFFNLSPGEVLEFPPLVANASEYRKIKVALPLFDGIVGNFPYIRQELIERQVRGYKREIVQSIARLWFWKDQDLFNIDGIRLRELESVVKKGPDGSKKWLEEQVRLNRLDLRLSGQSDIYAYLFFHSGAFLKDGGRIGIVTSNAWMDVFYGKELKRFFLRHFKIIAIVASWVEPWFRDAAINTAFTILERCEEPEELNENIVRFVKVKKPLSEILPDDLLLREAERWQKVDAMVRQIETAELQLRDDQNKKEIQTVETNDFRIRLVPQGKLFAELEKENGTAKWGRYIRAPQIYFDVIKEAGDKLVPVSGLAEIRRGYSTGINDFFYLEVLSKKEGGGKSLRVKNARGWSGEIEEDCLWPVIKSPKEAVGLVVDSKDLRYRIFMPPLNFDEDDADEDPEELVKREYPLAWEYIKWGGKQRTPSGQLWARVPSVTGRKAWWLLREISIADGLWMKGFNERFMVLENKGRVVSSDRFYELIVKEGIEPELLIAVLNSTLVALFIELNGRVNLGEGALDNMVYEVERCLVPDVLRFDSNSKKKIVEAYKKLRRRSVRPIIQEIKQKDRFLIDRVVMEALGLDHRKYLPEVYKGLVEMVMERRSLSKLRVVQRKQEKRLSFEQIKTQVEKEVLPKGLKPISAFLPHSSITNTMRIPLSGKPVSWTVFFNQFILLDLNGNEVCRVTGGEALVRYILYVTRSGQYSIEVPEDSKLVEKTVIKYEQYLRDVGEELFDRALKATNNHLQAEQIMKEILSSFDLPDIGMKVVLNQNLPF